MAIRYLKSNSFLHQLDARTKLIMFACTTVVTIIVEEPLLLVVLFSILYFLGRKAIDKTTFNNNLKVLVTLFVTFAVFQVLFANPEGSYFLFYLIPWKNMVPITIEALFNGITVFLRLFCVVLSMQLILYTTPPVEIALSITERGQKRSAWRTALTVLILGGIFFLIAKPIIANNVTLQASEWAFLLYIGLGLVCLLLAFLSLKVIGRGLPSEMGVALMLGFATVNILATQTKQITSAQKARGYDVQPKNLIERVKVLTALMIPILLTTLERSQGISVAILSRGFDYNIRERTFRRDFSFQKADYMVLAVLLVILISGLILNQSGMDNPTQALVLRWLAA